MNIDRSLLLNVKDRESLAGLLGTPETEGGLGWQLADEMPFDLEPEIAAGVKGDGPVAVSRLVGDLADERLVLLAEFARPYVRRDLRELLRSLRREIREAGRFEEFTGVGDTIFIVAAPGYDDVRFVLFEERERRLPRIRSFGWRHEFIGRTVLEYNLGRLLWSGRAQWEKAWDVEALTDAFYDEFVKVFDAVKAVTEHPNGDAAKHAYVQQMLNRLLFIAFVERMGWLKLEFRGPTVQGESEYSSHGFDGADYLHNLWRRHCALKRAGWTYQDLDLPTHLAPQSFHSLLRKLFFDGLDAPEGVSPGHRYYPLLGEVPYLNGGLFSEEEDLDHSNVTVRDYVFDLILGDKRQGSEGGLFRRFNFTVTESTPLDQEVAVDPEMLGKIFERIIIAEDRHRTGTYYTPRPIVEFMVNEALKGYLTVRGLPAEKAALIVDEDVVESDALSFKPSEMQDTVDWLFEVRAVDPACGSGAYLLMLLQRLFELVDRLEVVRDKRRDPNQKHHYNTKLRLLERCIYGVDISEVAVRIARLRLWLSLVVENKGEKPEPLPSFDFLIMCGDSLASPVFPAQGVLGYPHDAIRDYTRLKRRHFHPSGGQKRPARHEMDAKRAEISEAFADELANSRLRALSTNPFDWEVEFAEVFDPHESAETLGGRLNIGAETGRHGQGELPTATARPAGFDIVIANPPYVNSGELLQSVGNDYKRALVAAFPNTGSGTADLLIFFLDRALELLAPGGRLAFITSNKWLKAAYGRKLRSYLATSSTVSDLIDFRDLPVFQATIAYPLITIAAKGTLTGRTLYLSVPSLDRPYPDVADLVSTLGVLLPDDALGYEGTWRLETGKAADRLSQMARGRPILRDWLEYRVYRGVTTGLNEVRRGQDGKLFGKGEAASIGATSEGVFIIGADKRAELITEDARSEEVIKPLVLGRDLKRWVVDHADRWIVFTRRGVDIEAYPAVRRHLS